MPQKSVNTRKSQHVREYVPCEFDTCALNAYAIFRISVDGFVRWYKVKIADNVSQDKVRCEVNWLFNVTINYISVIHVTAHRCAGRLKK